MQVGRRSRGKRRMTYPRDGMLAHELETHVTLAATYRTAPLAKNPSLVGSPNRASSATWTAVPGTSSIRPSDPIQPE